ncbi:unnamed protein product [Orchesella dallaii]|uniref:Uncharacterized protein n=1 Tax=Orchesella dallaii TaxID=48710 RepID=A0ABP1PUR7_9HEXA
MAKAVNFTGQTQKVSFASHQNLRKAVIDSTRNNNLQESTTDAQIDSVIKSFFRNARDLAGGKSKRKNDILQQPTTENQSGVVREN